MPPVFLCSSSQICIALYDLFTRIIRTCSFSPYCDSKASCRSLGVTWTRSEQSFRRAMRRVDDLAGVLRRADAALLVQGAEPALAVDAEPLGDAVDLLVDLGGRDRHLRPRRRLLDQATVDHDVQDLLALLGHALVGELLARDRLAVDDAIGSEGFTGSATIWTPGTWIERRSTGLLRSAGLRVLGAGRRRRHLVPRVRRLLSTRRPRPGHRQDGQPDPDQPRTATAILCDLHVASPQIPLVLAANSFKIPGIGPRL